VYIGSVDWGFDFAHVNLRDARGRTRIARLWDQRAGAGVSPFGYGREIDRDAIDCALTAADPYAALDYDPADADADGTGTHGTHVIDIAAGSGRAPGSQPGIAPDADLLLVHLRGSDTRPTATLGDSVRLLEGIRWIADRAGARPVVINCSLGQHGGPHDGTTLFEQAIEALLDEGPGRTMVMTVATYGTPGVHSSACLPHPQL